MYANWAIGRGSFEGKNVGSVLGSGQDVTPPTLFKQMLADAGVNLASEIQSGGPGIGRQRAGRARRPEVRRPMASTR